MRSRYLLFRHSAEDFWQYRYSNAFINVELALFFIFSKVLIEPD